jgi:hypothetical protein
MPVSAALALLALLASPPPAAPPAAAPPAAAAAAAAAAPAEEVVAEVGSWRLTRALLDGYFEALPPPRRAGYERSGGKAAFLNDLIEEKLVVAEAERRGYLDRPVLRARAELSRDAVLYQALVADEVTGKVLTEEALKRWYDKHQDRFRLEEMARIRHILVTPYGESRLRNTSGDDARSAEAARAKIERIGGDIGKGADFAEMARQWSEDASAAGGGLLDDFPRGRMAQPIEEAAFSLAVGQVSGVLETPYGFHLVRVEARIPPRVRPFAEVRELVSGFVAEESRDRFRALHDELVARLRRDARVVVHDPALAAPEPAPAPRSAPEPAVPEAAR